VSGGPLCIGVLYPPNLDEARLRQLLGGLGRPVEVRLGHYEEDSATRLAKRRRDPTDALRAMAPSPSAETIAALADAEAVLALDVPVDLLALAPRLAWIQAFGAGVNQFDEDALWARQVRLTSAAGVGAPPIAEFVMGRILQVWKDFRGLDAKQQRHEWAFSPGRLLSGATIGIVGLGAIGSQVAQRARAFGLRVVATRRSWTPGTTSPLADELWGTDGLDALLEQSDIVVLSAPDTPETDNLIGAPQLARMKPGAVLCNVARGTLVDEDALVAALVDGWIRAAILDVARQEPLPPDHPLWDAPNVYISPHSSTSQDGYFDRVIELFARNVARFVAGERLVNLVEPARGY